MTIPTTSGDTPNSLKAPTCSAHITEELRRYDEHLHLRLDRHEQEAHAPPRPPDSLLNFLRTL